MNENSRDNLESGDNRMISRKKYVKSNHQIQSQEEGMNGQEEYNTAVANINPIHWNPSSKLACKMRFCVNLINIPTVLKCAQSASWSEPTYLATW